MSAIRVVIKTVISERSFGSIVSARIEEPDHTRHGQTIRVLSNTEVITELPTVGEVWRIEGSINDTEWGPQLKAERAVREVPTGKLIVAFLAGHVPGIGVDRAERLWQRWGLQLADVLSDESRIADVAEVIAPDRPNLAPALAAACCRAWRETTNSTQTIFWLAKQGVDDVRLARRLIAILGDSAVDQLQANPYMMVALLPWTKVDELGLKLLREAGVAKPRRDPRRLVGAIDGAVKRAIREGSTALDDITLRISVAKHLGVGVDSPVVTSAIELGEKVGAIVRAGSIWRAPGCAGMEDDLVIRLRSLVAPDYPSPVDIPSPEHLVRVMSVMRVSGHAIHAEQQQAVLALLRQPLSCLQGGAGVGKTTTLQAVCDLWQNAGGQVVLCTIAGKAALRLSKATHRLAMTLARLLSQLRERERIEADIAGSDLDERGRTSRESRLTELVQLTPTTLVVIDEASMVDLATAFELAQRLPRGARLLMVGDEAQLPPVGFGLVYHRLVIDAALTTRLTTVHRQSAESGIPSVAAAIRQNVMPTLPAYAGKGDGVSLLAADPSNLQAAVVQAWDELGGREAGTLICTATKAGAAGINDLNKLLQRRHAERSGLCTIKGYFSHWYCAGDPVVWLRNDYSRGLFNGLLGRVMSVDPESRGLVVQFDGYEESHEVSTEQLIDLALAYAITCHRAQGSQAPSVIVPLYSSRILDPSWLYTAVTRAERQVVLVGDPAVMEAALAQPWAARRRCVGLNW